MFTNSTVAEMDYENQLYGIARGGFYGGNLPASPRTHKIQHDTMTSMQESTKHIVCANFILLVYEHTHESKTY